MLSSENNDLLYLLNILEYTGKIWKYIKGANNAEELFELNEQLNFNASLTLLANIGENVAKLSESLKLEYPNIEWQKIKNFRNRIAHDYIGIDFAIVYEIITTDLKVIKPEIEKIIRTKIKQGIFDVHELKIGESSRYYKHINFDKLHE